MEGAFVATKNAKKRVLIYIGSKGTNKGLVCENKEVLTWKNLRKALNGANKYVEFVIFMANNPAPVESHGVPVPVHAPGASSADNADSAFWNGLGAVFDEFGDSVGTLERHESLRTPS